MTARELIQKLGGLSTEQLDKPVVIDTRSDYGADEKGYATVTKVGVLLDGRILVD